MLAAPADGRIGFSWDVQAGPPACRRPRQRAAPAAAYHPPVMVARDWRAWHEAYGDPGSTLARRLAAVQVHVHALTLVSRRTPAP